MDGWYTMISELGVPVAITFYLLHRIERKLEELNQSILSFNYHMVNDQQHERESLRSKRTPS
ncbi:YvrJ family protein [Texcoconibacillus texcoconensis]|uniref:YvrJ family protein n=1 Tax=Texcoconibacillus texcoconensis TaxID=1095777 RepID=A0A840QSS0_9BACI|nr:YvrJ family protein [Texcoconibacillus texcoconensis]MBB5174359.1 hypothetical protein [Texcoconibacillus texcoconensis]